MSRTGLCDICESRPAEHTCTQCGASVCDQDFDDDRGLCADCLGSLSGRDDVSPGNRDPSPGDERPDDDDVLR